jgi:cell division protein FtsQ
MNTKKSSGQKKIAHRIRRMVLIAALVVLGALTVIVLKVFTVKSVTVKGNTLYSDKTVEKAVMTGKTSWNSLFVYLRCRFGSPAQMPYASGVTVSMKTPHDLVITVDEKEAIGYVAVSSGKSYAYIDKTGLVLLRTEKPLDQTLRIAGLKFSGGTLYKRLKISDTEVLSDLLSISRLLKKYDIMPDAVLVKKDGTYLLDYGNVQVNLGNTVYLNEKMVRVQNILPKINKRKLTGTLHMETWTESATDIYFKKKELTDWSGKSTAKSSSKTSEKTAAKSSGSDGQDN